MMMRPTVMSQLPLSPSRFSAPPASGNAASFLGFDTTTVGGWRGHYGGQGYAIAADRELLTQ